MARTLARITHDEVARMLKAAKSAGLTIAQIVYNGETVRLIVDSGDDASPAIDTSGVPQSLAEYKARRDRDRARGN